MATRAFVSLLDRIPTGDSLDLLFHIQLYGDVTDADRYTVTIAPGDTPTQMRTKVIAGAKAQVADRVTLGNNSVLFPGYDRG